MRLLNLDGTSWRFWYGAGQGLRVRLTAKAGSRAPARQAACDTLWKAMPHVAVICDDTALQAQLPQVILMTEQTGTMVSLARWRPTNACSGEVWGRKSAWTNNKVFAQIIRRVGQVQQEHEGDKQTSLLMDAHSYQFPMGWMAAACAPSI